MNYTESVKADQNMKENELNNETLDNEEDEEEILVYVNFEDPVDEYSKQDLMNSKILGIDTDEPILQLGNKIFGGSWKETMGTAVFFEETEPVPKKCYFSTKVPKPLKYFAKTQKALHMRRIFISEKESSTQNMEKSTSDVNKNENHVSDEAISDSI